MCGPADLSIKEREEVVELPHICQICRLRPSIKEIKSDLVYDGKSGPWMVYNCHFKVCNSCYDLRIGKAHKEERLFETYTKMVSE
jgi:hypothetical protein